MADRRMWIGSEKPFLSRFVLAGTIAAMAFAASRSGRAPAQVRFDDGASEPDDSLLRGRDAQHPGAIPAAGWRDIVMRTWEQISIDRVMAVAAGVAFYALLAVFPGITALVSIYGLFSDQATVTDHLNQLAGLLPGEALALIEEQMRRIAGQETNALSFGFILGLGIALWSCNQGMKAMFDALNVAYGEREKRSFVVLNAITLGFTLAAILLVLSLIGAIVVLPVALELIGLSGSADLVLRMARWPLLLLVLATAISILYRFGPSRRQARWRWITPGSGVATAVWVLASIAFSWYVANFGAYNETYGSIGAVIGFMTWIWISALIILVGAELNAEIELQTSVDTTVGRPMPIGARGAFVADGIGEAVGQDDDGTEGGAAR